MGPLIDEVAATGDLKAGLAAAGISVLELRRARATDPAFDAGWLEAEEGIRLAAVDAVKAAAARGDLKAVKLLAGGRVDRLGLADDQADAGVEPLPSHVASAVMTALHCRDRYSQGSGGLVIEGECPWCHHCQPRELPKLCAVCHRDPTGADLIGPS